MNTHKTRFSIGFLLLAASLPTLAGDARGGFAPALPEPRAASPGSPKPSVQPPKP
jgi:hypothetical protein